MVCAVVLWNVAQRTIINDQPAPGPAFPAAALQSPLPSPGPVKLSAPTPPPADQTVPEPYVTPGLPQTDPTPDPGAAPSGSAIAAPAPTPDPAQFESHGAVFGAEPKAGDVVIQAKTRAALIVRGPNGAIFFARQLAAGDAYRVPRGSHATADASDPAAFDLYVGGKFQGLLTEPLTPVDLQLPAPAAAPAAAPPVAAAPSSSTPISPAQTVSTTVAPPPAASKAPAPAASSAAGR